MLFYQFELHILEILQLLTLFWFCLCSHVLQAADHIVHGLPRVSGFVVVPEARFDVLQVVLRVFVLFFPENLEDYEQVEDGSNLLTPMQEEGIEHMAGDIMVQSLFELFGEDPVVFVYHRQHLNKASFTTCTKIE